MKVKTKIVIHDYAQHPFPYELGCELALREYEVFHLSSEFFQSPNRGNINEKQDNPLLHVKIIKIKKIFKKTSFLSRWIIENEYGKILSEEVLNIRPDIFICCTTPLDPSFKLLKTCKKNNINYIFWLQDFYSIAIGSVLKRKIPVLGNIIARYYSIKEKYILKESDKIITIAKEFEIQLEKWKVDKSKCTFIPNWAVIKSISPKPKNNPWAEKHELSDKFCFLYSGTLGYKHNPEIFLSMAEHYKNENKVRIIIISEGDKVEKLKEIVVEKKINNVIFFSFQKFELMEQVLATADVLIAILDKEAGIYSVPSKILSYFCAQRPLLLFIPKENRSAKIVELNRIGLVIEPDNVESFLSSADRLYNDIELAKELGINARKYAEDNFDINRISKKFETIFNTLKNK